MHTDNCPFCAIPDDDILEENEHALAVRDRSPVSEGHILIITKRHVGDFFELSTKERISTLMLLEKMKQETDRQLQPDGYNIGMNIGEAAGQKIFHVHIHLIPRMKEQTVNGERFVKGVIRHMMSY
ncbi:MAG: HIT family protein [Thermodesulfovibrio sp.]|nr:HIT family protein [Thermodesulfovibrio sp.]